MSWLRYLSRRMGLGLLSVWGVCTITFVTVRMVADPVELLAGINRTPETVARLTRQLGLDRPLWDQYVLFLRDVIHGDLGSSLQSNRPVIQDLVDRVPATLELLAIAVFLAVAVSVVLAVLGAARPGGTSDRIGKLLAQAGSSLPPFWVGLLLIYVFFFLLGIAPAPLGRLDTNLAAPTGVTGFLIVDSILDGRLDALWSALAHLVLPSLALALFLLPTLLQTTKSALVQVLNSDYVRTARAVGMPARYIHRIALKNVAVSVVNVLAITIAYGVSGAVLVEIIFSWPGIGFYTVKAMGTADYAPVVGVVLLSAITYVVVYNLADVAAATIDPRIVRR